MENQIGQLYSEIVVLNSQIHKDLKVEPPKDFKKFKQLNSCIILGEEFAEACKYYPIVFVKNPQEGITPVVILGFENNAFIDHEDKWKEGYYIPAFVRRYPYILVEEKEDKEGERKLFVAIDKNFEGYGSESGERLFDDEGKNTEYLNKVIDFLRAYDVDYHLTMNFAKKIEEVGLLQTIEATVKLPDNKTFIIKNLFVVNEEKLKKLKEKDVMDLFSKGFLGWIYAHLISLNNFVRVAK